jgi:hypothetical protein
MKVTIEIAKLQDDIIIQVDLQQFQAEIHAMAPATPTQMNLLSRERTRLGEMIFHLQKMQDMISCKLANGGH